MSAFGLLSQEVREIASDLGLRQETLIQSEAIPPILRGENVLLISPTGSGKTEAAILPVLHHMRMEIEGRGLRNGTKLLYITPLRALNRDIFRRLEIWATKLGLSVEIRHGDTPQKIRRSQALHPPDILITTPETLQAILIGRRLRSNLYPLRWIIVDEVHELVSDRRGAQLSLALERVSDLVQGPIQRIGLSATVGNPEEVAKFLCGTLRRCKIVSASAPLSTKSPEYRVEFPEPASEDNTLSKDMFVSPSTVARMQRIKELIDGHSGTLVFVNSRTNAETLSSRFGMLGVRVGVHHGSLSREEREKVEEDFKEGRVHALVCTSTLELGIDIGNIDLVVQYMSPRQVNSLVQRVGRSGHSITGKSEGIILAVSPEDALESIVIANEARKGNFEPAFIHNCPLDVLAHQIAGVLLEDMRGEGVLFDWILAKFRTSYPFRGLTRDRLSSVVSFMEKLGYLRIDPQSSRIFRKAKCRKYYLTNLSMIPDERRYSVIDLSTQHRVGILGEEFVAIRAKPGVHFIIRGRVWQIESIQNDSIYVTPVEDPTAAVPGWDGELLPIPESVAKMVGKERGIIEKKVVVQSNHQDAVVQELKEIWCADRTSRSRIVSELNQQISSCTVPTSERIVLEKFGRYLIVHTSAGDRINLTLGELFEEILLREGLIRHWWNDGYRILIELTTEEFDPNYVASRLFHFGSGTEGFLNSVIRKHFPFGYCMKFIAERFGAIERGLLLSGEALKDLVVKFRFTPIYDETLREALSTKVDVQGALRLLSSCTAGKLELSIVESKERPSPLALYIVNRYTELEDYYDQSGQNSVEGIKSSVLSEHVSLLCFNCSNLLESIMVGKIDESPKCTNCGSSLLAVIFYGASFVKRALDRKLSGSGKLSEDETTSLSRARRSADLVLAYGKKGIIAQCVYGIGPQTASKVLSKMHDSEEAFFKDLISAKLKFIETKPYWN